MKIQNRMKLLIHTLILVFLFLQVSIAQVGSGPEFLARSFAGQGVSDIYIPFNGELSNGRTVEISVNYIEDQNSSWPLPAKAAFEYAASIWEEVLTSPVEITIDAKFVALQPGVLGQAGPVEYQRNFGSAEPSYFDNTWYPIALANRLAGVDFNPLFSDIEVSMSNSTSWYFGIDGEPNEGQYDFVTIALHEIAHGLGFISSARVFEQNGVQVGQYGRSANSVRDPLIYERFVANSENILLTDFDGNIPSTEIRDFLQSQELFWSSSSDANGAVLYAPTTFNSGASISHFDEATYNNTTSALMTPFFDEQEAIHDPGALGVAILQDIGWEAQLIVGIEDQLNIYSFDQQCWENPLCPNDGFDLLGSNPKKIYEIGESGNYAFWFFDEEPTSPVSTVNWRVEVLHESGSFILSTGAVSMGLGFQVDINALPTGFQWTRNLIGQVKARLVIEGTDTNGYSHESFLSIYINYEPNLPILEFANIGTESSCTSATLSFYAAGASGYNILYRKSHQSFWYVSEVDYGQFTHTIHGLSESSDYVFRVEAYNDYGTSISTDVERLACKDIDIVVYPNPTVLAITVSIDPGEVIDRVHVAKIDQPGVGKIEVGNGQTHELEVDLSDLPSGTYSVTVYAINEKEGNEVLILF